MKKEDTQIELIEIIVPFDKKKDARDSKLIFNKNDRKWYGTKETIETYHLAISSTVANAKDVPMDPIERNENDFKNPSIEESNFEPEILDGITGAHHEEKTISETCETEIIPETKNINTEQLEATIDSQSWTSVLEEKNTLKIALFVQKYGLPNLENDRITMLKILSKRLPGEYPITYDGMLEISEEFCQKYSEEYVQNLLSQCITGQRNYVDEVRDSLLSEEEKALLFFVLPI